MVITQAVFRGTDELSRAVRRVAVVPRGQRGYPPQSAGYRLQNFLILRRHSVAAGCAGKTIDDVGNMPDRHGSIPNLVDRVKVGDKHTARR